MNRLLQGDVGSGKTVVAVYAMLLCVARGYQAALMAPTEILARQHAETLAGLLRASRVRYLLLVGGLTAKQREAALAEIAAGEIDLVIGTHAVVQEDVRFAKLGLVVIDEQHKFGVRQRAALRQGEQSPHYLVMTATPIPRTISMTLFGDLDVTTLREMPPGRQEVRTYVVEPAEQARWWHFVREKLRAGRQAYVVAPLVDESENVAAASVAEAFERLTNGELADVSRRHDPRPHVAGRERRGDGRVPRGPHAGARLDERDRSRRRRAQRVHHGDRFAGAIWAGAAASAARPRRPRQAGRLLRRAR